MGKRAEEVRDFIEAFCTIEDGSPLKVQPWQWEFLKAVYPGRPKATRKVRRGLLSCARKNGKTAFSAGITLCHICGPEAIPGTAVVGAATSVRQAGFLFRHMMRMVEKDEHMRARIEIKESTKSMINLNNGVGYETISSRVSSSHGDNVAFWLYDELAQATSLGLYDSLDRSQAAVPRGGLGIVISTNSEDPGNPLADTIDMVDRGKSVGEMKHWHKVVYAADPEKDPYDWDNVVAANPNMGVSIEPEAIETEIEEARSTPGKRAFYKAYRLNQNAGSHISLCDPMVWRKARSMTPQAKMLADLKGEDVTAGLDLSDTKDLTAMGLWFEKQKFGACLSWMPQATLAEREKEDRVPYRAWADDGHLLTMPGEVIRPEVIYKKLEKIDRDYSFRSFRYDRYRMAPILRWLEARQIAAQMIPFGQGYKDMSPAVERFEQLLLSGELNHGGNPVLDMGIYNCKVRINPTNTISEERKPDKVSRHNRIDPAVALIMAIADRGEDPPLTADDLYSEDYLNKSLEELAAEPDDDDDDDDE